MGDSQPGKGNRAGTAERVRDKEEETRKKCHGGKGRQEQQSRSAKEREGESDMAGETGRVYEEEPARGLRREQVSRTGG